MGSPLHDCKTLNLYFTLIASLSNRRVKFCPDLSFMIEFHTIVNTKSIHWSLFLFMSLYLINPLLLLYSLIELRSTSALLPHNGVWNSFLGTCLIQIKINPRNRFSLTDSRIIPCFKNICSVALLNRQETIWPLQYKTYHGTSRRETPHCGVAVKACHLGPKSICTAIPQRTASTAYNQKSNQLK